MLYMLQTYISMFKTRGISRKFLFLHLHIRRLIVRYQHSFQLRSAAPSARKTRTLILTFTTLAALRAALVAQLLPPSDRRPGLEAAVPGHPAAVSRLEKLHGAAVLPAAQPGRVRCPGVTEWLTSTSGAAAVESESASTGHLTLSLAMFCHNKTRQDKIEFGWVG